MPNTTLPRETALLRCVRATQVRGGAIVEPGAIVAVDVEDVGAHLASGDFARAPQGAAADVTALLRPELPAPPAPVRLRWIAGNSSRQFDGQSVARGDTFETDPATAAALLEDRVAERVGDG